MAIDDRTIPYEILFRFGEDGCLSGAHYQTRRLIDIDGERVKDDIGPAQPVALVAGAPGVPVADVLGNALVGAVAQADQATARADAAEARLALAVAEITRLEAALAEARTEGDA